MLSYHQDDSDELLPGAQFAYNSALSDDLGISPLEADRNWNPKHMLDFITNSKDLNESDYELKERLESKLEDAKYVYNQN